MVINEMTPEGRIVNDLTIGEYDVIISTAPARDSFDEIQFAEALSLRNAGVMIPDDAIVEYSHLARKGELAKRIRTVTGVEPPSEEQAQMQQIHHEMEMEQIQLTIEKLRAEVQKLQSEAAINMAKTQDVADVTPQLKVMELESQMRMKEMELNLRRELADLTNNTRLSNQETSAATRIATTAMQQTNKSLTPKG